MFAATTTFLALLVGILFWINSIISTNKKLKQQARAAEANAQAKPAEEAKKATEEARVA